MFKGVKDIAAINSDFDIHCAAFIEHQLCLRHCRRCRGHSCDHHRCAGGRQTVNSGNKWTSEVVSALKKESVGVCNFKEGLTEGLGEEVTFEQRPEGSEGCNVWMSGGVRAVQAEQQSMQTQKRV